MTTTLESGNLRITFDEYGSIVALSDLGRSIDVVQEPRLANGWSILVPLPDLRNHYIESRTQRKPAAHIDEAGRYIARWEELETSYGTFGIQVTVICTPTAEGFAFRCDVENRDAPTIEEVICPHLGGVANDAERDDWMAHWTDEFGRGLERKAFDEFPGTYIGPAHPTWQLPYSLVAAFPFVDFYRSSTGAGFYLGRHDPAPRQSIFQMQLQPGTVYRGDLQTWPQPDEVGDDPIGTTLGWCVFPFLTAGQSTQLGEVVIAFHDQAWRGACAIFRAWWDEHFAQLRQTWLSREDAWLTVIMGFPDGTVTSRFNDLPDLARQAAEIGIRVLHIAGWHEGGLDRGYPFVPPNPHLGTREEFARAIADCEAAGVRVLLFSNLQVAHVETDWFEQEGWRYAVKDARQENLNTVSWGYHTTLGIGGQDTWRMHWMNPSHPGFQEVWRRELDACLALRPSGIQLDKVLGGGGLDLGPEAPGSADLSVTEGVLTEIQEVAQRGAKARGDFAVASESNWDRIPAVANATYSRFFSGDHLPTFATVFPTHRQTCSVSGPYDFDLVNNCLRYGHVISFEPLCFHGTPADAPELSAHINRILELRRRLARHIWDSRIVADDKWTFSAGMRATAHSALDGGSDSLVLHHLDRAERAVHVSYADPVPLTAYLSDGSTASGRGTVELSLPRHTTAVVVAHLSDLQPAE